VIGTDGVHRQIVGRVQFSLMVEDVGRVQFNLMMKDVGRVQFSLMVKDNQDQACSGTGGDNF
jgi:hypothetical protein